MNNSDPSGESFTDALKDFATQASQFGFIGSAIAAACLVVCAVISIPWNDVGTSIGNAWGQVVSGVQSYAQSIAKDYEKVSSKDKTKDVAKSKPKPLSPDTVIYRYNGTNPGNLTPKQKDVFTGLSFSTIPMPGSAKTTVGALNSTGVVIAIKDGATHVAVKPVNASMQQWINAGSNSIWTKAVKSVVTKWDGGK